MRFPAILTLPLLAVALLPSIHHGHPMGSTPTLDEFLRAEFYGTRDGITLGLPTVPSGEVIYGPTAPGRHPYPMYRYRVPLEGGIAHLRVEGLPTIGRPGTRTLAFKVVEANGRPVFYGRVQVRRNSRTGLFEVLRGSVVCGPFVYCPGPDGCVVRYRTLKPVETELVVRGPGGATVARLRDGTPRVVHEFRVRGLRPDTEYELAVRWNGLELVKRRFRTAVPDGASGFTFAFACDSRCSGPGESLGGGDADAYGCNVEALRSIMALAARHGARFLIFPGDLIYGHATPEGILLQYWNWKQAIAPWEPSVPVYVGYGNHEASVIGGCPGEVLFSREFVTPAESDHGIPDVSEGEGMPPYGDTVYWFKYGCVAVVVLNDCYSGTLRDWTRPTVCPWLGYVMDRQLRWLEGVLDRLERDPTVRYVFVAAHVPPYRLTEPQEPSDEIRPIVNGRPVGEGYVSRTNRLLEVLMRHRKVMALLCGHDHCYARYLIDRDFPMYPKGWTGRDVRKEPWFRPLWVIVDGNAGAPVRGLVDNPWKGSVRAFTARPAVVVLFHVRPDRVVVEAYDAVTGERVDAFEIPAPS
ncbi:metallophosphoesterase [Methanopyrus sp.]